MKNKHSLKGRISPQIVLKFKSNITYTHETNWFDRGGGANYFPMSSGHAVRQSMWKGFTWLY